MRIERRFARLLDEQFWVMGRDVEHPRGNLLLRLGFVREPSAHGSYPSRYVRDEGKEQVLLWPCGVLLGARAHGDLVLRGRGVRRIETSAVAAVWDPQAVIAMYGEGASAPSAILRASRWFERYERAVDRLVGVRHRVPRGSSRPPMAPDSACSLAPAWHALIRASRPAERDQGNGEQPRSVAEA